MKAIRYHRNGGPEVLQIDEIANPVPAAGEVVVDIHAASINPADCKVRSGNYSRKPALPHILGRDFSGLVSAVGPDADLAVGDEVYGVVPVVTESTYAEKIAIRADLIARKPAQLSHVEAAAVALTALTAMIALVDTLKVKAGEKVLIQGGAGGVGGMALQIAHRIGATVVTTARTVNHAYVRELGADLPIDYTTATPDDYPTDVDATLDTIGGAVVERSIAVLKSGGRAAFITALHLPEISRDDVAALKPDVYRSRERMERVTAMIEDGTIRPPQIETISFAEVSRGHELSESGHVRGKLVLVMPGHG